jgi:hypothetical protein
MHSSSADTEGLRRFEDTRASRQLRPDALNDIAAHRTPAKLLPLAPRPRETSIGDISGK